MFETVLVFAGTLLLMLWLKSKSGPANTPPSPGMALPLIGHLHLFKGNRVDQIQQWRQRLGDVFSFRLGTNRCVIISGYETISEVFHRNLDSVLGKPNTYLYNVVYEHAGIIALGGEKWKEQKAFLASALRHLGVGRNIMADRIGTEAERLVTRIESLKGQPTDLTSFVCGSVVKIIAGIACGERFDADEENAAKWMASARCMISLRAAVGTMNVFPALRYIPGDKFKIRAFERGLEGIKAQIKGWVDKDNREINISDDSFEDLAHAFLTKIERKRLEGVTSTSIDELNLNNSIRALLNGGMETTTNTIIFAILYLTNFPEIQRTLFNEINSNVGEERAPEVHDRAKLKHLVAFIMETQRFSSITPISIDRLVTKDIHVNGYTIEKGTMILANFECLFKDESVWGDPQNFRYDRFIAEDGSIVAPKEFLPFGVGKRNCIGESLASMELYLFISTLIQNFEFHPEVEGDLPTMVPNSAGFIRCAQPFKVRAVRRNR